MKSSARHTRSDGRKRYSAAVEKGENAWRREWGSFISNLTLKRVRDGYGSATLRVGADLKQQAILERRALRYTANDGTTHTTHTASETQQKENDRSADTRYLSGGSGIVRDEDEVYGATVATYSYLFNTPSERKAARAAQQQQTRRRAHSSRAGGSSDADSGDEDDGDDLSHAPTRLSRHQKALLEAQRCGLVLDDMTRKEKRGFLKLSVTRDQQAAQAWSKTLKLHELMDPKAAWYQQGPHPIDLISEKLVRHKAVKRGKQLGLRYNYYLPHPSWLARRAQHRRERILVGLGRRFVFDEDGVMCDALHQTPVDPLQARLLLVENSATMPICASSETETEAGTPTATTAAYVSQQQPGQSEGQGEQESKCQHQAARSTHVLPDSSLLSDPRDTAKSYVRAVVRNHEVAQCFHRANLTTNYLSSALVAGPNMHPQDAVLAGAASRTPGPAGKLSSSTQQLATSSSTTYSASTPSISSCAREDAVTAQSHRTKRKAASPSARSAALARVPDGAQATKRRTSNKSKALTLSPVPAAAPPKKKKSAHLAPRTAIKTVT